MASFSMGLISNDFTYMVMFPIYIPDYASHSSSVLDFFLSLDTSICSTMGFLPLENSDHVICQFSLTFYQTKSRMPWFVV